VILDFKEDHRRDNEFVSEKSALLKTLEAGQELLQDVRVSVSATVAVLINPLRYIAQRYEKEIVGASAAIALTALAKMLGLL
jgi:hypothetical protein